MRSNSLGRLTKVDLRKVFATEAGDFTPWLAQEENLALLGETINLTFLPWKSNWGTSATLQSCPNVTLSASQMIGAAAFRQQQTAPERLQNISRCNSGSCSLSKNL